MNIKELVDKYNADRSYYLTVKYNETQLRSDFLDPLFELFGWDIKNHAGKSMYEREVILEESLKSTAAEHSKKPDYTFRLFSERKFFLEAKKPSVAIESNDDAAKQVRRYGFTARLKISAVSNFEYLILYDASVKVESSDTFQKALIRKYHFTEYEAKFDEIRQLLGRDAVYSGQFDVEWQDIEAKLEHYSVDTIFLQQINQWRQLLGIEVFKHLPTIGEKQLNDIVQSYLNRILFLRVCEDRNLETYQTLLLLAKGNDFPALVDKFRQADKKYNSGLFDQLLTDKVIGDVSSVFWAIIRQLYYPESPYSFAVFSSDILGRIYEIFLSEQLVITGGSVVLNKKLEHVDRDIVTTPTFIINDILRNTVVPKFNNKTFGEMCELKVADIACGSGSFLLEAFQLLNDLSIDYYLRNDKSQLIQTNISTYKLSFKAKTKLLTSTIFGVDKDFNAVEAAKFGLLLKLLETEDTSTTIGSKPILPDLSDNILFGNSLLSPELIESPEDQLTINPFDFAGKRFDIIVGNPPYMKSEDMKNITPLELPLYKKLFSTAYKQFDKYFIFIERALSLLTEDGIMGFIVPSKFMKVGAAKQLRELLASERYIETIVSFGAHQIFSDKTTYTCLLFLTKEPNDEFKYSEIKDLTAWKIRDTAAIIYASEQTETLDNDVWPLVPPDLADAYKKIVGQSIKLVKLTGAENIFNGIQTSANDIYIFRPLKEDKHFYYFTKKGQNYRIEKSITKPYFQTSTGTDNLCTYRTFKPNARVFFPYQTSTKGMKLIPLASIKRLFPNAFQYLQEHKSVLNNPKRDIKPTPTTKTEWHRYGRHQSLDNCGLPAKIIVGVLSLGDKYAIDFNGTLISSGGTAGYCVVALPKDCEYSIYYIQALLNSKYLEWFSSLYGEVFRGGYIARGTKVLKNLPIREIDFDQASDKALHDNIAKKQKALISIFDQMDANPKDRRLLIKLNRQFEAEKATLDTYLTALYDLGSDDLIIPLIKEMYEAN